MKEKIFKFMDKIKDIDVILMYGGTLSFIILIAFQIFRPFEKDSLFQLFFLIGFLIAKVFSEHIKLFELKHPNVWYILQPLSFVLLVISWNL